MPKIELSQTPEAIQRRTAEVQRRMKGVTMNGEAYHEARRKAEAEVEAEELAQAETATAHAEAGSERARIASIVQMGTDMGRPKQALRLALSGPVGIDQAKSILSTLPEDDDAPEAALTLPEHGGFGSEAAQMERQRISGVFAHPAASGRFKSASALALEGSEAIPAEAVAAILAGLPKDAAAPRFATLEERAEGLAEFGADDGFSAAPTKGQKTASAWSRAISEANEMIGAGGEKSRPSGRVVSVDDDPDFGTTAAMPEGAK